MEISETLANFICRTKYSELPGAVVHQAKRCFLDWTGVALGGCTAPASTLLIELAQSMGGNPQATILGNGLKTSLRQACLVNGTMSHALDYDDVHMGVLLHPSAPVVPVVLALGEERHLSGRAAIEAFVVAYETQVRVGQALGVGHYRRGWHSTATLGRLAAAAAAGKLLGLDQEAMTRALGLAATQASGLRQVFGSMAKPFHAGKAAEDGLLAALLAERGFTCPADTLEGPSGFFRVLGEEDARPETFAIGPDAGFELMNNTFKPHASCTFTHPAIDCALEIRRQAAIALEDIESVRCRVPALLLQAAGQRSPQTGLAGKFSVYYCVALALAKGMTGEDQFTDAQVQRPELKQLQERVVAEVAESSANTEAEIVLLAKDGRELRAHTTTPKGDPRNPASDRELSEKFHSLASFVLPASQSYDLEQAILSLEHLNDLALLVECTVARSGEGRAR